MILNLKWLYVLVYYTSFFEENTYSSMERRYNFDDMKSGIIEISVEFDLTLVNKE